MCIEKTRRRETKKAVETANRLPLVRDSRDMVLPEILDGEAKSNQIVQNIWLLSDMFEYLIENLANTIYKDLDIKTTASGSKGYLVSREIFVPVREHARFKTVITELEKYIK